MNLEERKQAFVSCIATGAHPAPEFKWYIADSLLPHSDLNSKSQLEIAFLIFLNADVFWQILLYITYLGPLHLVYHTITRYSTIT